MKQAIFRIFLYFLQVSLVFSYCRDYRSCIECTEHHSWSGAKCRWCPLDRKCHAFGSWVTACKSEMNIKNPTMCYEEGYGLYDPATAFVNTLFSAAAYTHEPQQCLDRIYPNGGFEVVDVIGRRCDDFVFDYGECFAYTAISHTLKVILLAYRGTTSTKQLIDQILTVLFIPKQKFITGGEVQKYFKSAHDKLYACSKTSISNLVSQYRHYDVAITGHSLGGALASLASARLVKDKVVAPSRMSLYTFGMPRVGNKEYAFQHDKLVNNSWRVVHCRDIVSHLPTCNLVTGCSVTNGPFHHRTEIYYSSKQMDVFSYYRQCHGNDDRKCSNRAIRDNPCTTDINACINYHKNYFGIAVGSFCNAGGHVYGFAAPKYVSQFPNDTCKRIHNGSNTRTDDNTVFIINIVISVVSSFLFVCCLAVGYYKCKKNVSVL